MELIAHLPATIAAIAITVRLCLLPVADLGLGRGPGKKAAKAVKPAPTGVPVAYSEIA